MPSIKDLVLQRIEAITVKELKDLVKDHIAEILQKTRKLLNECLKKIDLEQIEKADLNLTLKLFKSPFMEKRLKGLIEIKEFIEKVAKNI